jgi:hypothetical protein
MCYDCIGLRFVYWIAGRMWASKYETNTAAVLSERPTYILVSFSLGPSFFGFRSPYQRRYCVNTFSFPLISMCRSLITCDFKYYMH